MSTEVWTWGDLFELAVPSTAAVRDLGAVVELCFAEQPEAPIFLTAFSPVPDEEGAAERAACAALDRFARSRGLTLPPAPNLNLLPHGVVAGRLAFALDLVWEAHALVWSRNLVVAFVAASKSDDPIFERARTLLATLRPIDLVVSANPRTEVLGDF